MITVTLNAASVKAKLDAWAASNQGKAAMANKIDQYIDTDVRSTQAGGRVITLEWVNELAAELAGMITANASGVADSVMADISTIGAGGAKREAGGSISCGLSFSGSFGRPSLAPELYGGIDNIIVLFEKGYSAHAPVYGCWHGEMVCSRTYREGIGFIASAVDAFNAAYAGLGITATVMGVYA